MIASIPGMASAQIGVIDGPANSLLSCVATSASAPLLRPEGYTELVGDILIACTGGPTLQLGAAVPTANIVVYISPFVPITSRSLGPSGTGDSGAFASEAMLIIDEAGSTISTGATGGYGPQAPQSLCTTAQQTNNAGSACAAQVGLDQSGQYEVSVVPGTSTPAQNVYQGEVGDFGVNSVTFYNVPVLPPAYTGVTRTFRFTNIRVAVPGGNLTGTAQAIVSVSPNQVLPIGNGAINVGVVGSAMPASVNAAPAGGGNPFSTCGPLTSPTLAARVTFTEGYATAFKTRVVPGGAANNTPGSGYGNTTWAAEAQNLAIPANQNIPGGFYADFFSNNESGFILPAAAFTDSTSNITYTAGLADFGTRLKAVFSIIPVGVTVYVSTTSTGTSTIPGGTSVTPYAVLVAGGQNSEANGDGATFAPLTSTTTGSDGMSVYPLAPDLSGVTSAIWEVVNADPMAIDSLSFNVYIAYGSTLGTVNPATVALSYAPEPEGGTFSTVNGTQGLSSPLPRFGILQSQGGSFATINICPLSVTGGTPVEFAYAIGGSVPQSRVMYVTTNPSNLTVTMTPSVTTPSGGMWLSASLSAGILTISVNPANLVASSTPYMGNVQLSVPGASPVTIPVTLTVYPPAEYLISASQMGNFAQGQTATYSVVVSNASSSAPVIGSVTVTQVSSSGLSLVSMVGTGWNCNTLPNCSRSDLLPAGGIYPPITVTVNVSGTATSPQTNGATLNVTGFLAVTAYDSTVVTSMACDVSRDGTFSVADVQMLINEVLGVTSPANDLNFDGTVNVADVQLVINAVLTQICVI